MAQTFKTYDGVEVSTEAGVWACYKSGYSDIHKRIDRPLRLTGIREGDKEYNVLYFSTEEACQAYIDKVNKPNLITEQIGDAKVTTWENTSIVQTEPMFKNPSVVVPPTPIILPNDNYFQLYVSGGESTATKPTVYTSLKDAIEKLGSPTIMPPPIRVESSPISTPTPETHPKLAEVLAKANEMINETESLYHPMITDFAKFYSISPNTVFEFIINQKSNQ